MKPKVICVDIDGVLTNEIDGFGDNIYKNRTPNIDNIKILKDYKDRGFKVILYTARHKEDIRITKEWLRDYKIPYDDITFNKPHADVYVDDLSLNQLDKEVLAFSGGLDSTIAYHYLQRPQPIYIKLNHRYQRKEVNSVKSLEKVVDGLDVKFVEGIDLSKFEIEDTAYISKRNLLIALIASYYGNKIYIVGIRGDKVEDKSPQAFDVMSFAMNFIQKPSERQIKIESPFWDMSKGQIIKWFLSNYPRDYVEEVLYTSVSCYDTNTTYQCGRCPACFRKWIGLEYAGIVSYDWFEEDIRKWEGIQQYINRVKAAYYDERRAMEIKKVLEKYNLWK